MSGNATLIYHSPACKGPPVSYPVNLYAIPDKEIAISSGHGSGCQYQQGYHAEIFRLQCGP